MATYKVLQDVEAEDKLVGPLSLRQFIYAAIAAICGYLSFLGISKHIYVIPAVFLPILGIAGFFAFPWKGDQPTEIWALAKLRFAIKPRRRIWDQSGMKDLVTVTAPKRVEIRYTNGLSQTEVKSRLHALADTIDSRGWATRNAEYNALAQVSPTTDRLINGGVAQISDSDTTNDILDENSAVAHQFDAMLDKSESDRRKRVMQQMTAAQQPGAVATPAQGTILPNPVMPQQGVAPPVGQTTAQPQAPQSPAQSAWFLNEQPQANAMQTQMVAPAAPASIAPPAATAAEPTPEEQALAQQFKEQHQADQEMSRGHLHVVQPLSQQGPAQQTSAQPQQTGSSLVDYMDAKEMEARAAEQQALAEQARKAAEAAVTHDHDDAIIKELATNDDEDIATLARRANKEIRKAPDEVEIRLH